MSVCVELCWKKRNPQRRFVATMFCLVVTDGCKTHSALLSDLERSPCRVRRGRAMPRPQARANSFHLFFFSTRYMSTRSCADGERYRNLTDGLRIL